jgi:hypothetical protein
LQTHTKNVNFLLRLIFYYIFDDIFEVEFIVVYEYREKTKCFQFVTTFSSLSQVLYQAENKGDTHTVMMTNT